MQRSLHSSAVFRFGLIAIVAALLARNAAAQADTTDPFVQLRGGAGDRAMDQLPGHDRGITYGVGSWNLITGNPNWPDLFFPLETLRPGLKPPILGEAWPGPDGAGFPKGSGTGLDGQTFFVGFALLGSRDGLAGDETRRIIAYQKAQQKLLEVLRAELTATAGASPSALTGEMPALAAKQDARFRELEREEEGIRSELAWVGPKLGRSLAFGFDGEPAADTPRLLFAANFYAGLSVDQRMLLVEIAHETDQASDGFPVPPGPMAVPPALRPEVKAKIQRFLEENKGSGVNPGIPASPAPADPAVIYFLPATARLHLPATLPPELADKVQRFLERKKDLKDELHAMVLREDYVLSSTRTRRFEALAAAQAPRFAELATLAEEIRVGLAQIGFRDRPDGLELPAELTKRVGSFYARKVQVRRELLAELRKLRSEYPGASFSFNITEHGDGLAIVQTGADGKAAAAVAEFNASQAGQYSQFVQESESLRREIEQYLRHNPSQVNRSVDQLAADFVRAYEAQGQMDRYREYSRAVLEPGLSPDQRRLLFNAALWPANPPVATPQS